MQEQIKSVFGGDVGGVNAAGERGGGGVNAGGESGGNVNAGGGGRDKYERMAGHPRAGIEAESDEQLHTGLSLLPQMGNGVAVRDHLPPGQRRD